jgi:signal transduction histidine kinase
VLGFKAEGKRLNLYHKIAQNFPKVIYTDGNRLRQVLINLISNSIKYTKFGEVRIEAEFKD